MPAFILTEPKINPLTPTEYTLAAPFEPLLNAGKSPLFSGIAAPDSLPGYAFIGYFPAYNLSAALGYRFVNTDKDRFTAAAAFEGESHHTYLNGRKGNLSTNAFGIRADYAHTFRSGARLDIDAAYGHDALKSPDYTLNTAADFKQGINRADFSAAISRNAHLDYRAGVKYSLFHLSNAVPAVVNAIPGYYDAASDGLLTIDGTVSLPIADNARFSTDAALDIHHCDAPQLTGNTLAATDKASQGIVTLNPALNFALGALNVRIGLRANAGFSTPGSSLHIAPDIAATWKWTDKTRFYATFGGGQYFNTLAGMYAYSPWAVNIVCNRPSYTPVNARAGLRIGSISGFSADIYAGYAATRNVAVAGYFAEGAIPAMMSADLSGWYAGFKFDFTGNGPFEASLKGRFMASGLWSGFADTPDGASATFEAIAKYRVNSNLQVAFNYRLRAKRFYRTMLADGTWLCSNLGNISSPGIEVDYAVTSRISMNLTADNLLCRRTYTLPGIASRRLTALLSVSCRF